jgi:putative transposase
MDRGFASWEFCNMKTEFDHDRYRVVWFCDLESRSEFRLATNGDEMTNEQVSEVYRYQWQIEVLWKVLKMHLKLDKLMTKKPERCHGADLYGTHCLLDFVVNRNSSILWQ